MILRMNWGVLVLLALLTSCSTVKTRIHEREKDFSAYPPEIQSQIQNGNIDEGFTEDMVYMARGNPAEKETMTRAGKTVTLWKYPGSAVAGPGFPSTSFTSPYSYPTFGPGPIQPAPYYRTHFIVEFEGGRVVGWGSESGGYRRDSAVGRDLTDGLPDK